MKKLLLRIICCFIPSRDLRHRIMGKTTPNPRLVHYGRKWLEDLALKEIFRTKVERELLSSPPPYEHEKVRIFKDFVYNVCIEISSFCNRRCWHCPNKDLKRDSRNVKEFPEAMYLSVLSELAAMDYDRNLCFSCYNEPLADKELVLKRIRQAREYLPNAAIIIYTNGDYLDRPYLLELDAAGLDQINVARYLSADEKFDLERVAKPRVLKLAKALRLKPGYKIETDTQYTLELLSCRLKNMKVFGFCWDFGKIGSDRAGMLDIGPENRRLLLPCHAMCRDVIIGYRGDMVMCCSVNCDVPKLKDAVFGNVSGGLVEAYFGKRAHEVRKALISGRKPAACATCNLNDAVLGPVSSKIQGI